MEFLALGKQFPELCFPVLTFQRMQGGRAECPCLLAGPDSLLEAGAVLLLASCSLLYTSFRSSTSLEET